MAINQKYQPKAGDANYALARIKKLGISTDVNFFEVEEETPDGRTMRSAIKMLEADKDGNLIINFWHLNRMRVQEWKHRSAAKKSDTMRLVNYQKIRYANPDGDKKYKNPYGFDASPYFPRWVVETYEKAQPIDTLIITEGELKAMVMSMHGIPTVALPGISAFKNKKTGEIYDGIAQLIKTCNVKNVVILYDGDATDISKKALDRGEDLYKRPSSFIGSAVKLREVLKPYGCDTLWCCNRTDSTGDHHKALDDMILANPEKIVSFREELLNPNAEAKLTHFYKFNITVSVQKVYKHFGTNNIQVFYSKHADKIGDKQFTFRGTTYQLQETDKGEKVEIITPANAKNYLRIGDDYFEMYDSTRPDGTMYNTMEHRKKGTIVDDHGRDFIKFIPKYKGRCNVPDYMNFSQVINNEYNMQFPLPAEPTEQEVNSQSITTTLDFFKHIFGAGHIKWKGQMIPEYELGLDYMYLLLFNRMKKQRIHIQKLPILVLVSKENHTGKSLFAEKYMNAILGKNAVTISNEDIESEFNAIYAYSRLICIEEALLDKKRTAEKIKHLSTAQQINANDKNMKKYSIDFVGAFVIASNNETRAVYVAEDDIRYWVRKVPVPQELNEYLLDELIEEIPAFMTYLLKRGLYLDKILTDKEITRMYFPAKMLETQALRELKNNSKPKEARLIEVGIRELFYAFPNEQEISMSINDICREVLHGYRDTAFISECLRDHIKTSRPARNKNGHIKTIRYKYPVHEEIIDTNDEYTLEKRYKNKIGKPYIFKREDFVQDEPEHQQDGEPEPTTTDDVPF